MKDTILTAIELSKQLSVIHENLDKFVKEIAIKFSEYEDLYYGGTSDRPYNPNDIDDWFFDGDQVYVVWQTTWNFGGHAEGNFRFPTSYLLDEKELENFKQAAIEADKLRKEVKAELERLTKINQLKQLQKELGV